jgi:hypothetical protein
MELCVIVLCDVISLISSCSLQDNVSKAAGKKISVDKVAQGYAESLRSESSDVNTGCQVGTTEDHVCSISSSHYPLLIFSSIV